MNSRLCKRSLCAGLAWAGLLMATPAAAQQKPPDLTAVRIEDLMRFEIEPVFGAARRLQPVTEAPASVTIITAEDITRFGYRTIAEILQGVRGFYVTNDRNYSFLGTRGFSQPGDYNTRVLLLVDGHRINDAIYDQAPAGHEFGLDPTSFERVEIIRGPSSSLYGTSAFFAVVNVITKGAANAASVTVEGGQLGTRAVRVQAAGALSDSVRGFVAASFHESDGETRLHFPEFADDNGGYAENLDAESARSVFAKLTWRGATLSGAAATRSKFVPTAAYDVTFNDPAFETTDARYYLDLHVTHGIKRGLLTIRSYVDQYDYRGIYPYRVDGESSNQVDRAVAMWWGAEARVSLPWGSRQTVTAGAEYRNAIQQDQSYATPGFPEDDWAIAQSSAFWALFFDDEVRVHQKVRLNFGVRYDAYEGFDRITPRASVIFNPSANEAFKYLFGTAFRAPNAYELDYYTSGDRSAGLKPETALTHELVWERYVGQWLRTSVSAYYNDVARLLQLVPGDIDYVFRNLASVHARGVEVELEMRNQTGWRALASYGLQEAVDQDTHRRLTNSPRHLFQARAWAPLPLENAALSIEVRATSRRETLQGAFVDPATIVNLGLVAPIARRFEVEASIRNVFNTRTWDPGSEEHRQDMIPQNGRVARVGLVWRWRQ